MMPSRFHNALRTFVPPLAALVLGAAGTLATQDRPATEEVREEGPTLNIQYLEIVTPDVEATCDALAQLHGVEFSDPVAEFGNARTASLSSGGTLGVRAPMHDQETPVVRPYLRVDDVESATKTAQGAGGELAVPPTEIPGHGRFSIYFQGGNQYGLWQL